MLVAPQRFFLNAGDTASIQLLIDLNSTDNVNVLGDPAQAYTYFSGSYISTSGSGGGGSGEVDVIDDNSTNAVMFPTWVTGTSGPQPVYVSSGFMRWDPSLSQFSVGPTEGDNISLLGEMIRWSSGPSDTLWDVGQLSGPIFDTFLGPPNWSVYDYSNSNYVLIKQIRSVK